MPHSLHLAIGQALKSLEFDNAKILLDRACSGNQNIPLFIGNKKSNATEFYNVDAMIIQNSKIKVIIKIEETNIKPTQICGKIFTSILSDNFINALHETIPFDDTTFFIQIVESKELPSNTSKNQQFKLHENKINNLLLLGKISEYKLMQFHGADDADSLKTFKKLIIKIL